MDNDKSPMFKAFLENQKFTDKEADDIAIEKQKFAQDREKEFISQLGHSQKISDYMDISSEITEDDINQTPEPHPYFKNYDHSLDMTRAKFTEDGAEILADGISIPEPEPEGLRLLGRGLPAIENGEDPNDMPDFGIDWGSIGDSLGL